MKARHIFIILVIILCAIFFLCACTERQGKNSDAQISSDDFSSDNPENELTYIIENGEIIITGCVNAPVGELVIPEEIDGIPVTRIFRGAFRSCAELTSVNMPSVRVIDEYAFYGCENLSSVEMPKVTKSTGLSFRGTAWNVNLTDEFCIFGDGVLFKCNSTDTIVTLPDSVKCVADFGINDCTMHIEMPSVRTVAAYSFSTLSVKSVNMPLVTEIGDEAFSKCMELTRIDMPIVKTIGDCAFYLCGDLGSIIISDDNTAFCADGGILFNKDKTVLFAYPSAKGEISLPDSIVKIDNSAFAGTAVTSIDMPSVEETGFGAFYKCELLTSVSMPKVRIIGELSFNWCMSLENVTMPEKVTIGEDAFTSTPLEEIYR